MDPEAFLDMANQVLIPIIKMIAVILMEININGTIFYIMYYVLCFLFTKLKLNLPFWSSSIFTVMIKGDQVEDVPLLRPGPRCSLLSCGQGRPGQRYHFHHHATIAMHCQLVIFVMKMLNHNHIVITARLPTLLPKASFGTLVFNHAGHLCR